MAALTGALTYPNGPTLDRGAANKLLDAVAGGVNGTGSEFGVTPHAPHGELGDTFALQTIIGGSGSFTSFNVDIEVSLDGQNWVKSGTSLSNVNGEMVWVSLEKIRYMRANKTGDAVAAGAPTLTLLVTY